MPCWSTIDAGLPVHGDQKSNPSTEDAETTTAYLTAVYQQPIVGEEHDATACLGPVGRNSETSNDGYVEGLCCRYTKDHVVKQTMICILYFAFTSRSSGGTRRAPYNDLGHIIFYAQALVYLIFFRSLYSRPISTK